MPNVRDFALNMLSHNAQFANNPQAQHMINVIQQGDSAQGEQIARNLCQTYGVNPQDAYNQAKQFFQNSFHIPF